MIVLSYAHLNAGQPALSPTAIAKGEAAASADRLRATMRRDSRTDNPVGNDRPAGENSFQKGETRWSGRGYAQAKENYC